MAKLLELTDYCVRVDKIAFAKINQEEKDVVEYFLDGNNVKFQITNDSEETARRVFDTIKKGMLEA